MMDPSNTTRKLDKLIYKSYERRRPKHEPTDTYFYLARPLTNCMTRYDNLNLHGYLVRTENTATTHIPISYFCSTYDSKSEELPVNVTLLRVCFMD